MIYPIRMPVVLAQLFLLQANAGTIKTGHDSLLRHPYRFIFIIEPWPIKRHMTSSFDVA